MNEDDIHNRELDCYLDDKYGEPALEADPDLIADERRQAEFDAARMKRAQRLSNEIWALGVAMNRVKL